MSAEKNITYEDLLEVHLDDMTGEKENRLVISESEQVSLLHNEILDLREKIDQYESAFKSYHEKVEAERRERSLNEDMLIGVIILIVVGYFGKQFLELKVYKQVILVVVGAVLLVGRIGIVKLIEEYKFYRK